MTPNLDTARAIVHAAETYGDSLVGKAARAAWPTVPMKECSRCNGNGYAQFCGTGRPPGICHRCWGKGMVVKGRKDAKMLAGLFATAEVDRLRALYRGFTLALAFAHEAERAGERMARFDVQTLVRQIAAIVEMGKAAAKEAA